MTTQLMRDEPTTPTPPPEAKIPPRARIAVALAVMVLGGLAVLKAIPRGAPAKPQRPFVVDGTHVDIREGADTWSYLEIAEVGLGEALPPEPLPAKVAFDEARSRAVVAPLAGRVDTVAVRLGQHVEQGDRLVAIRSASLVDLFKEIDLLESKEAARQRTVARLRVLLGLKAVPEKDLIAAEQDLRQVQLARESTELKLKSESIVASSDGLYWLTAPREGLVVERNVLVGQEVGPDRAEPLLVIANLDEVIVSADAPEADVADLRVGQSARIIPTASPDREVTGQVEHIGEVVDPVRRMVNVRVRAPNADHALRPNAFVQVAFAASGWAQVVIPTEAVVSDDQQSFVFVRSAADPRSFERRLISPGHQRGGQIEIREGLAPGEAYVKKGALLLLNAVDLAQG